MTLSYGNTKFLDCDVGTRFTDTPLLGALTDHDKLILSIAQLGIWFDGADLSTSGDLEARDAKRGRLISASGAALTRNASGINSLPTLEADGTASNVMLNTDYAVPTDAYTIIAVAQSAEATTASGCIFGDGGDNSGARLNLTFQSSGYLRLDHGTAASDRVLSPVSTLADDTAYVLWASYQEATGLASVGVDSATAVATATLDNTHKGSTGFSMAALGTGATSPLTGHIAEVLIIEEDWAVNSRAGDLATVIASLKTKWGIS